MDNAILTLNGIKTAFALKASKIDPLTKAIYKDLTSDKPFENYLFDEHAFQIKERGSNKTGFQEFAKKYNYAVHNKTWDARIWMDKIAFEDADSIVPGYIKGKVDEAALSFKRHPDKLLNDILAANPATFDGSNLFANSHNIGSAATIDNNLAITGTTEANIRTDLEYAYDALISFQWADGEPINPPGMGKFYVLVPAQLERTFTAIRNNPQTSTGVANPWYNIFDIILNSYQLTSDNTWYMTYVTPGREPLMFQLRKAVKWNYKDDPEDTDYKWLAEARYAAAPAWFTSIIRIA